MLVGLVRVHFCCLSKGLKAGWIGSCEDLLFESWTAICGVEYSKLSKLDCKMKLLNIYAEQNLVRCVGSL